MRRKLANMEPKELAPLLITGKLDWREVPEKHWVFLAHSRYLEQMGAEIGRQKAREIQQAMRAKA